MATTPETYAGAVFAGALGLFGQVTGEHIFTITAPTIVGSLVHVYNRIEEERLQRGDIIMAALVALAVGAWGGPWVAELAPASEKALPFMCFISALFATPFLKAAYDKVMSLLRVPE